MNDHHEDVLDEEDIHPTKAPAPRFDLDDAFSDNEDSDVSLQFTPEAIREELAKNFNASVDWQVDHDDVEDIAARIGHAVDPDASVSTFNIDAPEDQSATPPLQPSSSSSSQFQSQGSPLETLDEITFSTDFSQVSLSDSKPSSPAVLEEPNDTQYASYPAVQIDASEPGPTPTELRLHVPSSEPVLQGSLKYHSKSLEENRPETPPSSHYSPPHSAASTSSLPMPSSSSAPAPALHTPGPSANLPRHRGSRSVGPSALEKVISKTRPSFLPPKDRSEDRRHMADWESMMKHSRAAEEKRRKALQERRMAREKRVEESIEIWQREIVPDWTVVNRNPRLRKLWWAGIPTKLRATMWQNAVGNDLALSKDVFKTCLSRARRAMSSGSFPTTVLGLIDDDIATTLPALHLFHPETGPLYQDLKDMLCAWVVARSDEGQGYVMGVAKIAAMFLINMPPSQGFVTMRNLLDRHCLRSFYGGMSAKDDVEAYYRILDTLLADGMPKIYFNFKQHHISPSAYLPEWIIPLFLDHLPFEACARVWDILLLEGDSFLYRAALAILAVLEPRLFFPDRQELLELLRGENKAAIEVAKRDGRILNGAKYEIYGVDEETLWDRIEGMEDWWRESTWVRLIQRELPDL